MGIISAGVCPSPFRMGVTNRNFLTLPKKTKVSAEPAQVIHSGYFMRVTYQLHFLYLLTKSGQIDKIRRIAV